MNTITVTGMVISSMPIGEYDRRVEILTGDLGRISAFARGARKPSSPLVSSCRVFAFGEFTLFQGRSSYSLNEAKISNYFIELSENVENTYYGFYFLELIQYFSRENVSAKEMLKLLYQSLRALSLPSIGNNLIKGIFELKILFLNGVCNVEKTIEENELNESTVYALRYVVSSPVEKLYTFKLAEKIEKEFTGEVSRMIKKTVDKKFNSLDMLDMLGL